MKPNDVVVIPEPQLKMAGPQLWRVTATVGGHEVFFESPAPLYPRPEALVCPFLLPAMSRHANLRVAAGLDARFLQNLDFVRKRAIDWWPQLSGGEVNAPHGDSPERGPHAASFYTGGVDSSYNLQQLANRLRYVVFVEGFDIELEDSARLADARAWLSATAKACGVEMIVVRTNLRNHPLFRAISWEITHVSALAAVAHLLSGSIHTMYVAASDVPPPWGSAPDLDAAWSSASMTIENFSAELSRLDRVRSLARWEPLRGRLRVCWENNTSDLNCGFCEKCVRTRMQLYVSGAPGGLDSFPPGYPLRESLARLDYLEHSLHSQWREIASCTEDPALRREIERALQQVRPPLSHFWHKGTRRLKRIVRRVVRSGASSSSGRRS